MPDEVKVEVPKPWDEEYSVLMQALNSARSHRVTLGIFETYEATEVPGFEPNTLDQVFYGPRVNKREQPYGEKLQKAIAASDAQISVLQAQFDEWESRDQAYKAARDAAANAADPAKTGLAV